MVPKLRLSLFKDDKSSRWSLANLGEIVEFKKGKGISKSDISNNGAYPCVRYGELYTIYNEKIDKVQSKTNCAPNEHVISKSGDILIPASGETAVDIARASSIFRNDVILGGDINILTPKSNTLNSLFLSYSIVGKKKMELAKMAQGNSVVHLYSSQLKTLEIWLPLIDEQTKIAYFLSSVDEKIMLLNKQYDALCQYKKGMMQKIFSQEMRFKDECGGKFSDWNEILLGKVGEVITGKTPSTSIAEYWNGDILFTTPTDMNDSIKYLTETERKVTSKGIKRVLPEGTIMFTCIASIGKMALSKLPCITNQQINSIIVNEKYNNEFIYYHLQYIKPKIIASQANTTVPIVNKSDFSAISLQIPNLAEQTKIANFLSALDDKIAVKKAELDKLKTWKQGLLQQMFV